jgi:formylglycine-generating enzyme required for sulfatase activity
MIPRVPRRLAFGVQLCALGCALAGLSLVAPHDRVRADDGSDDRAGRRAEWAYEKTATVDVGGGVKMEFVLILPGTFRMGSPPDEQGHSAAEQQHVVRITRPFYLAKYPTTQEQYEAVTGTNPSHFSAKGGGKDQVAGLDTRRFPVESITWNAAATYCARMTKNDARRRTFRLPTEAEWEYACRAGTTTPYHFGSELNGKQANCHGQVPYGTDRKGPSLRRTTKVGSYPPNAWGLYDMHGNVYQWCEDYYGPYDRLPAQDPLQRKPQGNGVHVLRCGAWDLHATYCRAAYRDYLGPDAVNASVGFRVAFHPE